MIFIEAVFAVNLTGCCAAKFVNSAAAGCLAPILTLSISPVNLGCKFNVLEGPSIEPTVFVFLDVATNLLLPYATAS